MRRSLTILSSLFVTVLLAFVHGQQPAFRTSITSIQVDVSVTDEGGAFVKGLTKEDFEILDDGRPQSISTFSFVDLPAFDPSRSNRDPLESDVTTNAGSDEGRLWVILLDGSGNSVFALRALDVARQFINEAFGPNDLMAVIHVHGTMTASQSLTRSRSLLLDSLDRFRTDGASGAPRSELTRFLDAYRVVEDLSRRLGAIRSGRKTILWVGPPLIFTPRLNPDGPAILAAYGDMVRTAQRNNVALYPISPTAVVGATLQAYGMLADDTGGSVLVNTRDGARTFADIVRDNGTYYLLGYYPTIEHRDGKFHGLTVRVKRPGVTVRARRGYLAPDADAARREAEAAPRPGDEVREALRNPIPSTGLVVDLSAVPFKGSRTAGSVLLAAHVRDEGLVLSDDRVDIAYRALDGEGRMLVERGTQYTLTPQIRTAEGFRFVDRLELPRGRHEIRFAAHLSDGKTGSVVAYVEVPDFTAGRMALSGLSISSTTPVNAALLTGSGAAAGDAAVTTVRQFTPKTTLTVRGVLYADSDIGDEALSFAASIRGEDGTAVREGLTVTVEATGTPGQRAVAIDVPLADLRRGGYLFTLEARTTRGRRAVATRQLPFWVVAE